MYNYLGSKTISLSNLRTILICVSPFMGFLLFSQVVKLRHCDIFINKTFLSVFIEKRKTDIYRVGSWLYLTKLNAAPRPIDIVSQFFKKYNRDNCQKCIFRAIITTKSHSKLNTCDKHISYTCARENVFKGFRNIGGQTKLFGLHSLRAGGARAAANLGVNDSFFKKHEKWKSEKVKDGYIHINWDSLHARLKSHYEVWSYKKKKHKLFKRYRKSV